MNLSIVFLSQKILTPRELTLNHWSRLFWFMDFTYNYSSSYWCFIFGIWQWARSLWNNTSWSEWLVSLLQITKSKLIRLIITSKMPLNSQQPRISWKRLISSHSINFISIWAANQTVSTGFSLETKFSTQKSRKEKSKSLWAHWTSCSFFWLFLQSGFLSRSTSTT